MNLYNSASQWPVSSIYWIILTTLLTIQYIVSFISPEKIPHFIKILCAYGKITEYSDQKSTLNNNKLKATKSLFCVPRR